MSSAKKTPEATVLLSYPEKKRARLNLGKREKEVLPIPFLLATQMDSYEQFLQANVAPTARQDMGLEAAFRSVFPMTSYSEHAQLEYVEYALGQPLFDVRECKIRGLTYAAPLKVKLRLVVFDKEEGVSTVNGKAIKEQDVYLGEIPLMTNTGSFIINGSKSKISPINWSPLSCNHSFFTHTNSNQWLLFTIISPTD